LRYGADMVVAMPRMAMVAAEAAESAAAPSAVQSVMAMVKKFLTPRGALVSLSIRGDG
jgi:high-affinity K+ transport system ATPase subunit B